MNKSDTAPAKQRKLKNGNTPGNPFKSPRCGAKSRRTGLPCRAAGIKKAPGVYGRCRMHGGRSTGAKTPEGKKKASHEKDGKYSQAAIQSRRELRRQVKQFRLELAALQREVHRAQRAGELSDKEE